MRGKTICLLFTSLFFVCSCTVFAAINAITSTVDLGPLADVDIFADPLKPPINQGHGIFLGTDGKGYFPSAGWQERACYISITRAASTFTLSLYAPDQEERTAVVFNPPVLVRDSQGYPNPVTIRLVNRSFLENLTTSANAVRLISKEVPIKIDTKVDTLVFVVAGSGGRQAGLEAGLKVVCVYDEDMDEIVLPRIPPPTIPGNAALYKNVTQAALALTNGHECLVSFPLVKDTGQSSTQAIAGYAYAIYPNREKTLKNIYLSATAPPTPYATGQEPPAEITLLAISYKKTPLAELVLDVPKNVESYKPFMVTLTAQDGFGWVEKNYDHTVHFSTSDPWFVTPTATSRAVTAPFLPLDYKFMPDQDKGVKNFWVNLVTPGSAILTVEEAGKTERRDTGEVAVERSKVLQAITDARLSRTNLCLLPTAYTGYEGHESGLSLSSSFDFCWYIGKLYYYEKGKVNFTDRIGTSMLSMDGKAGVVPEGDFHPAMAGGLWGGFIFPLGNSPEQQQSLDKFSSAPLFNFFMVASKRVANGGVHSGFVWGNLTSLFPTIDPLVASDEPVGMPVSTTIPAKLVDFPKHTYYAGFDYPLGGKLNVKVEFLLPYEVRDVYIINTQIEHFAQFDLAYIKHPYGYALLGWFNVRVIWFPSS